ncbi:MAG: hypothetical protein JXL84_00325, partial [Deltaproteobacteria bacterium]|nr:hypothetical protein [Deltaproteobacteria bacterium]
LILLIPPGFPRMPFPNTVGLKRQGHLSFSPGRACRASRRDLIGIRLVERERILFRFPQPRPSEIPLTCTGLDRELR